LYLARPGSTKRSVPGPGPASGRRE
jgi:hypothetical protein